jgi:hypothetical protein
MALAVEKSVKSLISPPSDTPTYGECFQSSPRCGFDEKRALPVENLLIISPDSLHRNHIVQL